MRSFLRMLIVMALGVICGSAVFADEMIIEPNVGFLEDIIVGDTTATGARNNPDRVYVLRRNAEYLISVELRNVDWKLSIKAEDGQGALPIIRPYPDQVGAIPQRLFRPYGDVEFHNLLITGKPSQADLPIPQNATLRSEVAGLDLIIDGCIFNEAQQGHLRVEKGAHLIKVTNTIFANMGKISQDNQGNGRAFDIRDAYVDSLIVKNCTFVNGMDRILRHRGGSGTMGYVEFDHITIVNSIGFHAIYELGNTGDLFKLTNSLFINPMGAGNDANDPERLTEFDAHGEKDANGKSIMYWIGSIPNDTTVFEIDHNYYYESPELDAFLAGKGIPKAGPLTQNIRGKLADALNAFMSETVVLANIPNYSGMVDLLTWHHDPAGANKQKITTATVDWDRRDDAYYANTLDCSYSTTLQAYSGSSDGTPVGDLNWFTGTVAVEKYDLPQEYSLRQNYPNPFNPMTTIGYYLPKSEDVSLVIYNSLGQKITALVNEKQTPGYHEVTWNGLDKNNRAVAGGVYLYRFTSGEKTFTRKMLLLE